MTQASEGDRGHGIFQEVVHLLSSDEGLQPSQLGHTGIKRQIGEHQHTPPSEMDANLSIFKNPHNVGDQDLFKLQCPVNGSSWSLGFKPLERRLAFLGDWRSSSISDGGDSPGKATDGSPSHNPSALEAMSKSK